MTREEYALKLFSSMDTKEQDDILFIMQQSRPWQKSTKYRLMLWWIPAYVLPATLIISLALRVALLFQ